MPFCAPISVDEFESDPRYREVLDEMHGMMGIADHPLGRRCKLGHGRRRRAEIEGGKHLEYPWAVVHGDFQPGCLALDAGCGRGILMYYLASKGVRMAACDIDCFRSKKILKIQQFLHRLHLSPAPDMTSRFRSSARSFGVDIDFHIEPIQRLSWPSEQFDRVFSISVLEHIQPAEEQRRAVQEMARVLKRGGRMILTLDYAARRTEGKDDVFLPEDVRRVIDWSKLEPLEPPKFDVGDWDIHLNRLAEFFSVPECLYSAYTLVLKK